MTIPLYASRARASTVKPHRPIGTLDSPPANFDPAAHPIIGQHFFNVGPQLPIGQVLPAVLADLARTMAASSNSLQNQRNKEMNEQELESLNTVIRYLWRDEQKNFEECEVNDGEAPDDHIFRHLETLRRYLTHDQAADVSPFI